MPAPVKIATRRASSIIAFRRSRDIALFRWIAKVD
jgi:hypothetical protein